MFRSASIPRRHLEFTSRQPFVKRTVVSKNRVGCCAPASCHPTGCRQMMKVIENQMALRWQAERAGARMGAQRAETEP